MKKWQMSESYIVAILLAVVGGYLDSYTYICRDGVFANAETGNIILFGINLINRNYPKAIYFLIPIVAFSVGVFVTEMIRYISNERFLHWRQSIILVEILTLFCVSLIPQGKLNVIATMLVAFVSALQVDSFRKMHGDAYATMFCTGNLRSATEAFFAFLTTQDVTFLRRSARFGGVIVCFILGAVLGAFISANWGIRSLIVACGLLLVVFSLMFFNDDKGQDFMPERF